ncbi:MAG: glycosyl transferase family protein [Dactylosporangium sp.]|jgi:cellulose synthase/poly-beta-1,6-N-acetylglucosamine synthase-like glycosyltransferase|nr:glycosyl transferase family protein [Dactylosporangium sp.]
MEQILLAAIALVSLVLTAQAAHVLYLMIYTWDQPEADAQARVPDARAAPHLSFTAIVPARHEEEVIQQTIDRVARTDYPARLVQIIVVCSADDTGTIERAAATIRRLNAAGRDNVQLVVFDDLPINKPHGLNAALVHSEADVITIFDAEDEIHPEIFSIINTIMVTERVHVVQAGVQLMNYESNWYSTFNVLEYFFWFRSRLHYQAKAGAIPLGGNTIFFARHLLEEIGGWDETCLTEDAEIGLRICVMGERVRVVYDHRYVTKEETPPTLQHFIKQRTRWSQGFMQTLRKGTWKELPTRKQRWLAWYTLMFPYAQALLGLYLPVAVLTAFVLRVPVPIALLSWLPVLLLAAHFITQVIGLYEFTEAHEMRATPRTVVTMAVGWLPYQMLLAYSAMRALKRQLGGVGDWEKTAHVGAHRNAEAEEVASRAA